MEVLVFLVPLAFCLGLLGLAGFMWSLRAGQYDDLDGAAWRALGDDDTAVVATLADGQRIPKKIEAAKQ